MSVRYAFTTLLTSDAYLPGALTIAAALKDLPSDQTPAEYETVCLVTPETVDVSTIRHLRKAFNVVIGVEVIVPPDSESLTLLGRPDLDTALTKLHVFRLTQYSKVIFLDADVLPLRPLSHLFHLEHEFSAVPDVGWPDIFNSGVMVFSPGEGMFKELQELLNTKGTWDGADQGLLNEWRGNNWNRLSFTYNTTPTAIYTYAPAYRRFGSQISAVHFIGPHKPWHSIAYRAPGSVDMSSDKTPTVQHPAYDYDSLVDRWYNVYDRHHRSQLPQSLFQPGRYTSAWNDEDHSRSTVAAGALGLEELRRAALEGMEASGIAAPCAHGEGEYQSMPLEGRFDLIRPRTRAERKLLQAPEDSVETPESTRIPAKSATPEPSTPPGQILTLPQSSPARWMTLPTPGINELPSAPHARLISLPPTPLRYVPSPYKPLRSTREAGAQTLPIESRHQESGKGVLPAVPLTFHSVVQKHPDVATPVPIDTYFPKIWDVDQYSSSVSPLSPDTSLTTEPSPSQSLKLQPSPGPFTIPSATPVTPHRQEQYRNATGKRSESPTPDPTKVRRVFPWEERPRHAPGRVFPDQMSLLGAPSHVSATPEKKHAFRSPMPSPLVDFPPSLQPHYPPESPVPQKYMGKVLPWSIASSSSFGLEDEFGRVETSSQDGDIEDEVESESEETAMRSRRRGPSIGMLTHSLKYRSIGVQTDPRELRDEGTQVTTFVPATEVAEKLIMMNRRLKRNWSIPSGSTRSPAVAFSQVPSSPLSRSVLDLRHSSSSSGLRDDRTPTFRSNEFDDPNNFNESHLPATSTAVSSTGDIPLSHDRKGSRVWDPARGVETFKKESEEVLAKFMKIGTSERRV